METRKFTEEVNNKPSTHWLLVFSSGRERDIVLQAIVAKTGAGEERGRWYIGTGLPATVIMETAEVQVKEVGFSYSTTKTLPVAIRLSPTYQPAGEKDVESMQGVADVAEGFAVAWKPLLAVFNAWAASVPHGNEDIATILKGLDYAQTVLKGDVRALKEFRVPVCAKCAGEVLVVLEYADDQVPLAAFRQLDGAVVRLIWNNREDRATFKALLQQVCDLEQNIAILNQCEVERWPNRLRAWWAKRRQPKKEVPPVNKPETASDTEDEFEF